MSKIYIEGAKDIYFPSLKSLLEYGFSAVVDEDDDDSDGDPGKFLRTYHDEDCTKQQCHEARRSFGDLLMISRTYFPDTTEADLSKALHSLRGLVGFVCPDIGKVVFVRDRGTMKFEYYNHSDLLISPDAEWTYQKIKNLIE